MGFSNNELVFGSSFSSLLFKNPYLIRLLTIIVIEQINPLIVLTPANADPNFIETLQQVLSTTTSSTSNSNSNSEDDSTSCQLEFRPPREFYAGQGKQALSSMIITEGGIYDDGEPNDENNPGESKEYQRNREDNENEERNAYDYGKSKYRRRNDNFEMQQGDRGRRNRELRLEGFLNGLDASPLTVSTGSLFPPRDLIDRLILILCIV